MTLSLTDTRYTTHAPGPRLHAATQHYDFVADIFSKLVNEATERQYHFSLREMRTYDVIKETESAYCDIGVIAIKSATLAQIFIDSLHVAAKTLQK